MFYVQHSGPPGPREIRLPQALEKVLEFKSVRAQEMGLDAEDPEDAENEGGNCLDFCLALIYSFLSFCVMFVVFEQVFIF